MFPIQLAGFICGDGDKGDKGAVLQWSYLEPGFWEYLALMHFLYTSGALSQSLMIFAINGTQSLFEIGAGFYWGSQLSR